ncbi:MAG: hypothetical protein RQ745_03060 [Longimicrobiales bacterium]|nr:hypothetical protein [Longimicrobiales bacterium]
MKLKRIADIAVVVALGTGLLSAIGLTRYSRRLETALDAAATTHVRAAFRDRMMAAWVDLSYLDLDSVDRPTLYWHVDFDRCDGCFNSIATWNALAADARIRTVLSYSGTPDASGLRAIRTMTDTDVLPVPERDVQGTFGGSLASSKLLLDPAGVVLLADTRYGSQVCGWSFDDAVMQVLDLHVDESASRASVSMSLSLPEWEAPPESRTPRYASRSGPGSPTPSSEGPGHSERRPDHTRPGPAAPNTAPKIMPIPAPRAI